MARSWLPLGPLALLTALVPAAAQPPDEAVMRQREILLQREMRANRPAPVAQTPAEPPVSDDDALRSAGLYPPDGPKLVDYLKLRTVSDADHAKIRALISQLKADRFDARLAAAAELERYGPAAVGPLKAAEADPDFEVAYRVGQVLRRLEKVKHAAAAAAAVRGVVRLKPPGAAGALIGYLPMADSEALADDIRAALVALAAPGGKPDPALVAALADPSPVRRGAAYVALVEGGPPAERIRIKEGYDAVKAAVRAEADPDAKFRGVWALLLTTREKGFVPDLIALTPALPWGRLAQAEDLLLQLAGGHPPGGRFGRSAEARAKARDAWAGWWAAKGGGADLVKLPFTPRVLGLTDVVETVPNTFGGGRVASLGPDGKERWHLDARSPSDLRVLPGGRVLTIEGYNQVLERDSDGRPAGNSVQLNQPLTVEPLPGGGRLVFCRPMVIAYDQDGKEAWRYARPAPGNDIVAGCRLPNGETAFVTTAPQGPNCFRLDAKGKEVGKGVALGRLQQQGLAGMAAVGPDRVLVGEAAQVAEYDLKTGKLEWKYPVSVPTSVQRLVNGNTLIASANLNRVVEVDPAGEVVWEYKPADPLRVARAYRR
ncbi:MAG: PQQ-like beta-propeller repeat protein [Gemmataceae bacterium]|nr:PQQ-like beta-propeller repeat protein [Gemmataceae bacterium]